MDLRIKWNGNTPDWPFTRKSGTMIYRALPNAQSKQTGEREEKFTVCFVVTFWWVARGKLNLPVGRWHTTGLILLRRHWMFQQFGLKHYGTSGFCSFPEAEENPHQVTSPLAKPASETADGNHTERSDQASFHWHVTIPDKSKWSTEKKAMSASFP